jgi:hypothetical protein
LEDLLIATSIDDFVQPLALWNIWDESERNNFVCNVCESLKLVKDQRIVSNQRVLYFARQLSCYLHLPPVFQVLVFESVDIEIARRIWQCLEGQS